MQARDEQQTVQHTEHECAERTRGRQPMAGRVDHALHRLPYVAEHNAYAQTDHAGDNRHEAFPSEECEVVRQLDVFVLVVQQARDDTRHDPGQHAHVELVVDVLHHRDFDQITDRTRETCHAVVVFREADCHTDREQQRQVIEDRAAGVGDHLDVEHIGLAQSQQQAGNRQHCNRQHQRPAQALNLQKRIPIH